MIVRFRTALEGECQTLARRNGKRKRDIEETGLMFNRDVLLVFLEEDISEFQNVRLLLFSCVTVFYFCLLNLNRCCAQPPQGHLVLVRESRVIKVLNETCSERKRQKARIRNKNNEQWFLNRNLTLWCFSRRKLVWQWKVSQYQSVNHPKMDSRWRQPLAARFQ